MTKDRTPDQPENPENTEIVDAVEADVEGPADETTVLPTDDTAQFEGEAADVAPAAEASRSDAAADVGDAVPAMGGRSDESQDPFWHPRTPESETAASSPEWTSAGAIPAIPAAAAAAGAGGTAYPPNGPTGPGTPKGPGFWRRVGDAWRRVWSSALGKVLVIGAAALAVLAIVAAIGMAAFMGGRGHMGGDRGERWAACADQGQSRSGQGMKGNKQQAECPNGQQGRQGQQRQRGQGQQPWGENEGPNAGRGNGTNPGTPGQGQQLPGNEAVPGAPGRGQRTPGLEGLPQGGLGLGAALHGEVVVGGATPKTILFQTGEVTEYTDGASIAVKSTDGFTATYALTPTSIAPQVGLTQGQTVRVIAEKDGAKVMRIELVRTTTTN